MKTYLIESRNHTTMEIRTHIQRPGFGKTFCGKHFAGDWAPKLEIDLKERKEKSDCQSCERAANWFIARVEKNITKPRCKTSAKVTPEWSKNLSSRGATAIRRIMIFELKVATFNTINSFSEQNIKDALIKAIEHNLIPRNLRRLPGIGADTEKQLYDWLGIDNKSTEESNIQNLKNALKKIMTLADFEIFTSKDIAREALHGIK